MEGEGFIALDYPLLLTSHWSELFEVSQALQGSSSYSTVSAFVPHYLSRHFVAHTISGSKTANKNQQEITIS